MSEFTASTAPLPDAKARAHALEATQSFIVQAPAGSGKTELLTQRYLRLLALVERPEQILAITFTRKAASEMRNRILKALNEAEAEPRPEKAHELLTWQLARAACDRDVDRGWQLRSYPARLRIQTIDALNMSLARRLPILSGAGASLNIAADTEPLYEAACLRVVKHLGENDGYAEPLETVLFHLGNRVDRFTDLLLGLLQKRDQWLPILGVKHDESALRTSLEQTLSEIVCRHLTQLRAAIPEELHDELAELLAHSARNRLAGELEQTDVGLLACRELMALPGAVAEALDLWRTIARLCLKDDGDFYKSLDKRHGFPPASRAEKERMLKLLERLRNTPPVRELLSEVLDLPSARYDDSQWQVLNALLEILPLAEAELQWVFKEHGEVDYVESAWRALRALGTEDEPTDVALAFDERLQHILVDEFQDTSFTQLELLKRLTAGWTPDDGRSVFCVGDPMQSIYRFREAEVGLFLKLQTLGLPNVRLEALKLSVNFRSTRPVVQWINDAFPRVLPPFSDAEQGAVHFSRSETQPNAGTTGGAQIHAAIDRSRQAEAELVVQLANEALRADEHGKIAVLVANRNHVGEIAASLAANGIGFQAVEIERLRERPVVQDLLSLTRALVHLGDRTAWLSVLRAPWCGLSLTDLHALAADDAEASVWSLLCNEAGVARLSEQGRLRVLRIRTVLEAALAERGRLELRDWIERCWNALGGPATSTSIQDLQDAEAFFARLEELDTAADLEDVARLEDQLKDLYARPRPGIESRIEIMTIHKAKGLEFDTVILPSLERGGGRDDAKLLQWSRVAGLEASGLVLAPISAKGAEVDPVYRWLKYREQRRTNYERGRQLYVAATRARKHLHLLGSVGLTTTKEGVQLRKPRTGSLLALLWPVLSPAFENVLAHGAQVRASSAQYGKPVLLRRLPLEWTVPAPAAAAPATSRVERGAEETDQPEFNWVGETARHIGTTVHRELERLVKAPAHELGDWNAESRRRQFELELAELGVPEDFRHDACDRVIAAVQRTLHDPRGRWILDVEQSHREASSEIALTGLDNGKVVSIVIDRSFVDRDGTRWIVDFKTSSHEGGGPEEFLAREEARYRSQLARYAKLMGALNPGERIRAALYFPLLGAWREVSL